MSEKKCNCDEFVYFNSVQAAEYLNLDIYTLRNLTSNGKIPYYKLGRSNRYLKSELDMLLSLMPKGERLWE